MGCDTCGVVNDATARIQKDKRNHELKKLALVCMTIVLVVACVCATVLAMFTVRRQHETIMEQQYALNMQYASLMDYVAGAEIVTETETYESNTDDGGTAIVGDQNTVIGGNVNGDG